MYIKMNQSIWVPTGKSTTSTFANVHEVAIFGLTPIEKNTKKQMPIEKQNTDKTADNLKKK